MFLARSWAMLSLLVATVLAAATGREEHAASAPHDLERNRQLLQKWKGDPEHYARLQRDLRDFWAMPKAQRDRLRQLDKELHELDDKARKRLWIIAERYRMWLERLPEAERRAIEEAPDASARLQLIKDIRTRQWIERAPRKVREQLEKLPAEEQSRQVQRLREQERQRRRQLERPLGGAARPR